MEVTRRIAMMNYKRKRIRIGCECSSCGRWFYFREVVGLICLLKVERLKKERTSTVTEFSSLYVACIPLNTIVVCKYRTILY